MTTIRYHSSQRFVHNIIIFHVKVMYYIENSTVLRKSYLKKDRVVIHYKNHVRVYTGVKYKKVFVVNRRKLFYYGV